MPHNLASIVESATVAQCRRGRKISAATRAARHEGVSVSPRRDTLIDREIL